MKRHEYTIEITKSVYEMADDIGDALGKAGCYNVTLAIRDGVLSIRCLNESESVCESVLAEYVQSCKAVGLRKSVNVIYHNLRGTK